MSNAIFGTVTSLHLGNYGEDSSTVVVGVRHPGRNNNSTFAVPVELASQFIPGAAVTIILEVTPQLPVCPTDQRA
jgi:hypothetical protein